MPDIGKRHAIFIQNMIDFGETPEGQIKAYRIAYPKATYHSARTRSYKLSQKVEIKRLIAEGRQARQKIIEDARRKELVTAAEESLLSQIEVDAKLHSIINGTFQNSVKKLVFNPHRSVFEVITVMEPPDASQVIAAADKYYRRNGSYAAKKTEDITPPQPGERDKVIFPGDDDY